MGNWVAAVNDVTRVKCRAGYSCQRSTGFFFSVLEGRNWRRISSFLVHFLVSGLTPVHSCPQKNIFEEPFLAIGNYRANKLESSVNTRHY